MMAKREEIKISDYVYASIFRKSEKLKAKREGKPYTKKAKIKLSDEIIKVKKNKKLIPRKIDLEFKNFIA